MSARNLVSRATVLLLFLWIVPPATFGQAENAATAPLAERLSADTIVYVGSVGSDGLQPAYQKSHLKSFIDSTDLSQLLDPFIPQLVQRINRENREAGEVLQLMSALGKPLFHYPSAFVIGGIDLTDRNNPMPRIAILTRAGAEGPALKGRIEGLLQQAPLEAQQRIKVTLTLDVLSVSIGYNGNPLPEKTAPTLGASAGFKAALAQAGKNPAGVMYVNVAKLMSLVDTLIDQFGDDQMKQAWPKLRGASGLDGVRQFVAASGFDGADWTTQLFLDAPEARKGLVSMVETGALSDAVLATIPQGATLAGAGKLDAAKLIAGLRTFVGDVEPNAVGQIDDVFNEINKAVGFDVHKDLLGAMGDEWAYYTAPAIGGRGMLGVVFVNRLRDAARAEESLARLETLANQKMPDLLRQQNIQPQFFTTKVGDLTIHYLGTPVITPSYAIRDGNLYMGLFPQVVASAAAHVSSKGRSILENPDFVALRTRLGGKKASGIYFMDLPRTAPDAYAQWVMVSRLAGFADLFGVKSPAMMLPPLGKLLPELAPSGSMSWIDKDGFHARSVTPFPGAEVLASDPLSNYMALQPLMVSTLLPSLSRAREQANRAKSANNLRQQALAGMMAANEDVRGGNRFPPAIEDLMKQDLQASVFVNPRRSSTEVPPFTNPKDAGLWVKEHSDYIWAGAGLNANRAGPDDVLAYENPAGLSEGINIAFGDAHVEFVLMPRASEMIARREAQMKVAPAKPVDPAKPRAPVLPKKGDL